MIPNRLIFIWFGQTFPYGNLLALRSARRWFKPDELLLIVDNPEAIMAILEGDAPDLLQWPELQVKRADTTWFEGLPHVSALAATLFGKGLSPATKANLIRLAALYKLGGVYLDFDTITIGGPERDPRALLSLSGFCGTEPLSLPASLFTSKNPLRWIAAGARLGARQLCANVPSGWKLFRGFEALYPAAPNNAVLGAVAGHPFLETCFRLMAALPPQERVKRFRLGTHLLQRAALAYRPEQVGHKDWTGHITATPPQPFVVLPPPHFYPLGPEIATHWFKPGTAAQLDAMLQPETTIVHWYNSVEVRLGGKALTRRWVETHGDTAFAELVRRYC
jgi:hypothetical protein